MLICFKGISHATGLTNVGTHHLIGLSQKNDCILSLGGIDVGDYNILNAQTGFAYNNKIAFQVGYQYFSDSPYFIFYRNKSYLEHFKDHFFSGAIGTFYTIPLGESKLKIKWKQTGRLYNNSRHLLFDAYVAYGKGLSNRKLKNNSVMDLEGPKSNSKLNFNKYYVQTGVSYRGSIGGLSIAGLFGVLNMKKIKAKGVIYDELLELVYQFRKDANYTTWGYHFKFWLEADQFKLIYHYHQDFLINKVPLNFNLDVIDSYYGQISLQVNINQLFKKNIDEF